MANTPENTNRQNRNPEGDATSRRTVATALACAALGASIAIPGAARAGSPSRLAIATDAAIPGSSQLTFELRRTPQPLADSVSADPDAPDGVGGDQTHVIYFVPSDRENENLHTNGTIPRSIDAMRAWFRRETAELGMPALEPRIDVTTQGGYDISFVRGNGPAATYTGISAIVDELIARGYNAANKRYLIYSATSADQPGNPGGRCGEAYYPLPGMEMRQYAVVHLNANEGCRARDFANGHGADDARWTERIAAHEWLHNEGAMPLTGPHTCTTSPYHACTGPLWLLPEDDELGYVDPEFEDVMFPIITGPLRTRSLDRDRDDYLDHPWAHVDLRDSSWMT